MTTLAPSTDYTGASVTQGGKKTFIATMRTFISELLGTDSGDKTAARAALGVPNIAGDTFTGNVNIPSLNGGQLAGLRNALINGIFSINQRAPATNADDTYAHDRWYTLTQTGTIAVSTLSDVENGTPRMARLTQSQASAQRMGYAQIIEGVNCKGLRGKEVTFRFGRTRMSASTNVRFAVLEWTGTEDTVTSDVVNDWTSSAYTAGNFFLGSNLTVSGVVQQALTANTLADGSEVTVTLGSTFNNLIVFAWTESTVAQNVTFDLGKAQLEIGGEATPFEARPLSSERSLCENYYNTIGGSIYSENNSGGGFNVGQVVQFPTMRVAPTLGANTGAANTNTGATSTNGVTTKAVNVFALTSANGQIQVNYGYTLSAEL